MPAKQPALVVFGIVVLAAVLRCTALDFGDDLAEARPDELGVVATLHSIRKGTLFPMHLAYGGGYHYPLYGVVRLREWLGGTDVLAGPVSPAEQPIYHAARLWSALLATATVWLTYLLGRRLDRSHAGAIGAALLASSTLAVREAHFAKADSAATFAAVLLLLTLASSWSGVWRRALAMGAAAGLAVSTKYLTGFLPAVIVALATGGPVGRRVDLRSVAAGVGMTAAVALALNPFWLTSPRLAWTFARAVMASQENFPHQAWLVGTVPGPLRYHVMVSLRFGCGAAFAVLTVPALLFALRGPRAARLIALTVAGHWVVLMTNPLVVARNLLPIVPALSVLIARLVASTIDRFRLGATPLAMTTVLAVLLIAIEPATNAVTLVRVLGRADTRTLAGEWIGAHLPAAARIVAWGAPPGAADFGLPPLGGRPAARHLPPERWHTDHIGYLVWHQYPLPYSSDPLPASTPALRRLATFDPFGHAAVHPVLEPLDAFYLPLAGFRGVERAGPHIEIFELLPP